MESEALKRKGSKQSLDSEGYLQLVRQHESDLLRHAMRLCNGDRDWAKDLVQDAIIAGFQAFQRAELDSTGNVRSWLIRVLTNRFINQYKRKRRWEADVPIEDTDGSQTNDARQRAFEAPDAALVKDLFDEPLNQALSQLPDEQRECVLLVDVEELEYAEAAKLLNVPVGTIRSRLARGRLRLYTLLLPYARNKRLVQ